MSHKTSFNPEPIVRAQLVVLDLMKKRRFFLAKDHELDSDLFSECISLDRKLKKIYKYQQDITRQAIEQQEFSLGVSPPTLKDGQSIVTCSLYTSGLDICGVYPIQMFTPFIPKSYDELFDEVLILLHGGIENIAPKYLPEVKKETKVLTDKLWGELQIIVGKEDGIVLLMETKFEPNFEHGFGALKDILSGFVIAPKGLAYLFYKKQCVYRLTERGYTLFDVDKRNHPCIEDWDSSKKPGIYFKRQIGYDCKVKFVCLV